MRYLLIPFLIFACANSCADPIAEKQLRAEQSIQAFEMQREMDTVLVTPTRYSELRTKDLKFDVSPEANYFPYLNLQCYNYYWDQIAYDSIKALMLQAGRGDDKATMVRYSNMLDSMNVRDSMMEAERAIEKRARDSCEKIYGDRRFYHVVAHDSLDKVIGEYMLDTINFEVLYWRFSAHEVYRSKDQRPQ